MIPRTLARIADPKADWPERNVLVVDDVPEIGDIYRSIFRRVRGFSVRAHIVVRSDQAIDLMARERFDLVITDLRMPQRGGREIVRAARAHQRSVPVILMTGASIEEAPKDLEVEAFLTKPLDLKLLVPLIEKLLSQVPQAEG